MRSRECLIGILKEDYKPVEIMLFALIGVPPAVIAMLANENAATFSLFLLVLLYIGYYGLSSKPRHTNTIFISLLFLIGEYGFLLHLPTSARVLPLVIVEEAKTRSTGIIGGTMYPDIGQFMVLIEVIRLTLKMRLCSHEDINTPDEA